MEGRHIITVIVSVEHSEVKALELTCKHSSLDCEQSVSMSQTSNTFVPSIHGPLKHIPRRQCIWVTSAACPWVLEGIRVNPTNHVWIFVVVREPFAKLPVAPAKESGSWCPNLADTPFVLEPNDFIDLSILSIDQHAVESRYTPCREHW